VNDPYNENYKIMKKEMKKTLKGWKNIPCLWINRINILKMSTLPNAIYSQCNGHQNPNVILHRNRKINAEIHMKA
jgi:hypothetical protein